MTGLPRAILFDLDDTILSAYGRPDLAWRAVTRDFATALAPFATDDIALAINTHARDFWADAARHKQWRQNLTEARREIVAAALKSLAGDARFDAGLVNALADRFTTLRDEEMKFFPGAIETVDELKSRGVLLALVTNGAAETQRGKIARFDLAHRFHHIQIEGEHGFGKPEDRAYLHAMATLGVEPHETWMVGDNLEWEVAAPQRLGIHAIWHDPHGEGLPEGSTVKPDRIIRSLTELLP
jgi:putative hydrolase of the HAD superfamily